MRKHPLSDGICKHLGFETASIGAGQRYVGNRVVCRIEGKCLGVQCRLKFSAATQVGASTAEAFQLLIKRIFC